MLQSWTDVPLSSAKVPSFLPSAPQHNWAPLLSRSHKRQGTGWVVLGTHLPPTPHPHPFKAGENTRSTCWSLCQRACVKNLASSGMRAYPPPPPPSPFTMPVMHGVFIRH